MAEKSSLSPPENDNGDVQLGVVLRKAREAASYSVAHVAAQIHLQEEVIVALENERFDQLPENVFVRGYIRSYAKLLEIDSQELIDACPESTIDSSQPTRNKKSITLKSSGADPVVIWSSVTVVALLVGLLMTWWIYQGQEDPVELASVVEQFDDPHLANGISKQVEQDKEQQDSQHQVVLGGVDPKHISVTQNEEPDVASEDEQLAIQERELQFVPTVIEAPISSSEIDKMIITVKYTQESWTEIFDARKRRLLHGLIKLGATRVISGQAPFNVFLGNSPGVQLEINGKLFDHSVYMRRNNTARFLIDDNNS